MYLVQGLLGLSRLAVFSFFKDELKLDPGSVGLLTSLGYAPWVRAPPPSLHPHSVVDACTGCCRSDGQGERPASRLT